MSDDEFRYLYNEACNVCSRLEDMQTHRALHLVLQLIAAIRDDQRIMSSRTVDAK